MTKRQFYGLFAVASLPFLNTTQEKAVFVIALAIAGYCLVKEILGDG